MALFQQTNFISAAGIPLSWKIECDALSDEDWRTIAAASVEWLPRFKRAIGVPHGGLKLAEAFNKYVSKDTSAVLIVDDVWTTGKSLTEFAEASGAALWFGFVAFARSPLPPQAPVQCFLTLGIPAIPSGQEGTDGGNI